MRFVIVPALALALLASSCASTSDSAEFTPSAADRDQERSLLAQTTPIAESTATLSVHGLSCPKCASNVDLTLAEIKGVKNVEQVDLSTGEVKLAFDENTHPSPAALAKAVKDAGYTLVAIRTP
jgi:copper chaperone CopZ